MEKNSNSTKILRLLYFKKEKISAVEISQKTKIPLNLITAHTNKMIGRKLINKEIVGHRAFYFIPSYNLNEVKRTLEKAEERDED